jgi:hypothetical protein
MILGTLICIGTIMIRIATEPRFIQDTQVGLGDGILTEAGMAVLAGLILDTTIGIPTHFATMDSGMAVLETGTIMDMQTDITMVSLTQGTTIRMIQIVDSIMDIEMEMV